MLPSNIKPRSNAMPARDILTRMATAAARPVKVTHHGGAITCTEQGCENPSNREPIMGLGRPMGVKHAHYATPLTVDVGASMILSVNGIVLNADKDRRAV